MKKIVKSALIIGLLIIATLSVGNCSYEENNECLSETKRILVDNLKPNVEIDFQKQLSCFEWDEMMFLDRHFQADYLKKETGVSISEFKLMGYKSFIGSDFYTFIVFLKNKEIVGVIETSNGIHIDEFISELDNNDSALIDKQDAKFITYETDNEYLDSKKVISIKFSNDKLIDKYKKLIDLTPATARFYCAVIRRWQGV